MASAQSSSHIMNNHAIKLYDFDPGVTTVVEIAWVDMRDYEQFLGGFFRTVGTSALTFAIIANDDSAGGGTDVTIKTHAVGSEPDAVGDQLWLECTAEEIGQLGAAQSTPLDLRYITVTCSTATNSDEGIITYMRTKPRFAASGLTADIVA